MKPGWYAAFPQDYKTTDTSLNGRAHLGLTKREYLAAMAMQGLMAVNNKGSDITDWEMAVKEAAKISVSMADALLIELAK